MSLDDVKHKVLDFVDAVKSDPKKQIIAVAVVAFAAGVFFGRL